MNPGVSLLLDLLVKSLGVVALAAAVVALAPGASAATRHLAWLAAFAALVFLPLSRMAAPRWTFAFARSDATQLQAAAPRPEPLIIRSNVGSGSAANPAARPIAVRLHATSQRRLPAWGDLFLSAWAGGALLVLVWRLIGAIRVRSLRAASTKIACDRMNQLAAGAAEALGVRAFELRHSARCGVPLTWGTWRPIVMLPLSAPDWPVSRLVAALRHELAHVCRRDHLIRLLAQIVCALYWPNPLVWLAARALRTAQEQACDDLVLRAGTCPAEYAAQLLEVSQMFAIPRAFDRHAVAMARPSTLETRVAAIVDASRNRAPAGRAAIVIISVCTMAVTLLSAAAQFGLKPSNDGELRKLELAPEQQIELRADFIDLSSTEFQMLFPAMKEPGYLTTLSLPESAALRRKLKLLIPAESPLPHASGATGSTLLAAPRVITRDGQRVTIETMLREHRVVGASGQIEIYNEGITLDMEPRLRSDEMHLSFRASLVKLLANPAQPLTSESFHRVEFGAPQPDAFRLRANEVGVFGGWKTADPGRHLLLLIEGRCGALELASRLNETILPEVRMTGATIREAADYLLRRMPEWNLPVESSGAAMSRVSIVARSVSDGRNITLDLRNVSAAHAVREVARAAGLRAYVGASSVQFAPPLPAGALQQANAIVLPEVKLTAIFAEALDKLIALAREEHPEAVGVRIERQLPTDFRSRPLTIEMSNVPLSSAVALVTELAGYHMSASANALYIHPPGAPPSDTMRVIAPAIGANVGTVRVATEAEMRAGETIDIEAKFIELPFDQLATAWWKPPGDPSAGPVAAILTAEQSSEVLRLLNSTKGADLVAAPRVKCRSGNEVTVEIGGEAALADPGQARIIRTIALSVKATLAPDGQMLTLDLAPWRSERRAADNVPLFSTRKAWSTVSMFTGQTAILTGPLSGNGRAQLILVSASILSP